MAKSEELKKIYEKLATLESEVKTLREAVLPEITLSRSEMAELRKLKAEARAGNVTRLEDIGR